MLRQVGDLREPYQCLTNTALIWLKNEGISVPFLPGKTHDWEKVLHDYWHWGYAVQNHTQNILDKMEESAQICAVQLNDRIAVHYVNEFWKPDYYVIHCHRTQFENASSGKYIDSDVCDATYENKSPSLTLSLGNREDKTIWAIYDICNFMYNYPCGRQDGKDIEVLENVQHPTEKIYNRSIKMHFPEDVYLYEDLRSSKYGVSAIIQM